MPNLAIFDLDSTLANNGARRSFWNDGKGADKYWHPANVLMDTPIIPIKNEYIKYINDPKWQVIILTGRTKNLMRTTRAWLKQKGFPDPDKLIMRPDKVSAKYMATWKATKLGIVINEYQKGALVPEIKIWEDNYENLIKMRWAAIAINGDCDIEAHLVENGEVVLTEGYVGDKHNYSL